MTTSSRSIARQLLVPGVVLLLIALVLQILSPALYGQQSNDLLPRIPWQVITLVGFLGTVALMVGSALVAGAVIARAVIRQVSSRTSSRDVTIRFGDDF